MRTAIERAFPEAERPGAIAALETVTQWEWVRLRIDVLVLAVNASATAEAVERYARCARTDGRDVILWAEYSPKLDYGAMLRYLDLPDYNPGRMDRE